MVKFSARHDRSAARGAECCVHAVDYRGGRDADRGTSDYGKEKRNRWADAVSPHHRRPFAAEQRERGPRSDRPAPRQG